MKVKLLVGRCGPTVNDNAGDEITVSEDEGKRMIAANQAVPVRQKRTERATKKDAVETAVK